MALTPDQRAQIARENGAKTRGPVTPEGKARSSRNALKHGLRAEHLAHYLPPHPAVMCNEERKAYYEAFDHNLHAYAPKNFAALQVLREITYAQWEIDRNHGLKTAHWNDELLRQSSLVEPPHPAMHNIECARAASAILHQPNSVIAVINREIDRLHLRIARLEKRFWQLNDKLPAMNAVREHNVLVEQESDAVIAQTNEPKPEAANEPTPEMDPSLAELPNEPNPAMVQYLKNKGPLTPEMLEFYKLFFAGGNVACLDAREPGEDGDALPRAA